MNTQSCRTGTNLSFRLGVSIRALGVLVLAMSASACSVETQPQEETISAHQSLRGTGNESRVCCKAMIASCLACQQGVSVQAYCASNPETVGCPRPPQPNCDDPNRDYMGDPQTCASMRFFCNPGTTPFYDECGCGCERQVQPACCEALTASCLACSAGTTIEQYCLKHPETHGCTFCMHSGDCESGERCTTEDGACLRKPGSMLTVCYGLCTSSRM